MVFLCYVITLQLPDCQNKCIMEVRDLDYWIVDVKMKESAEGNKEIETLDCPKCKTPIRRSQRYGQQLKQLFLDVQKTKMKIVGDREELMR